MSYDAVYQVTRGLRMLLHSQLTQVSPGAAVTLLPPGDDLPEVSGVNLYLYRVVESPYTRNRFWPGDRTTPPSHEMALGLQLFYLLTPLGLKPPDASSGQGDDAHTMLGMAMLTLHEHPVLNDVHLPGFDADVVLPTSLLESYEQIKVCLASVSLEDLSKIWASINRPYRLSVAYEVSLVELTPTAPLPVNGGVVTSTGVEVITLDPPRLTSLTPPAGALASTVGGVLRPNTLAINGYGFSFPGQTPTVSLGSELSATTPGQPTVRLAGQPVPIATRPAPADQTLSVVLPVDLDAGPDVDVRMSLNGRTSTALTFTVTPWLARIRPIRTALDPAQPGDLTLALEGTGFTASPQSVRIDPTAVVANPPDPVTAFKPGGTDTRTAVAVPVDLPNGLYTVRIVLGDQAGSASNSRTLEVMPLVGRPIQVTAVRDGQGREVDRLTVNGARLAGSDVRLTIDGVVHQLGAQQNPAQIVHTLGRALAPGTHGLAVTVDGHMSRSVDLEVQ